MDSKTHRSLALDHRTFGAGAVQLRHWTSPPPTAGHAGEGEAWSTIALHDEHEALAFLRDHTAHGHGLHTLRGLLDDEDPISVLRLNNEQVLQAVATLVMRGQVIVCQLQPPSERAALPDNAQRIGGFGLKAVIENTPPTATRRAANPSTKVSVSIALSQPVACPGHKLSITAKGSPEGGSYSWVSSGAGLFDARGEHTSEGDTVYLWAFRPDAAGQIVEIPASVSVTYTHPDGTATDKKPVKVHKIDFEVSNTRVETNRIEAQEGMGQVNIDVPGGVPMVQATPTVAMKLHDSCPRKTECAAKYRVGWLQDVLESERVSVWRHRQLAGVYLESDRRTPMPFPIRDGLSGVIPPFNDEPLAFAEANPQDRPEPVDDSDWAKGDATPKPRPPPRDPMLSVKVHFEDTPSTGAVWSDPKANDESTDDPLEEVIFRMRFALWLVVQNTEWADARDVPSSLAYLRHVTWSLDHSVKVDVTQRIGSRCTPKFTMPSLEPATGLAVGRGSHSPCFKEVVANDCQVGVASPRGKKKEPAGIKP